MAHQRESEGRQRPRPAARAFHALIGRVALPIGLGLAAMLACSQGAAAAGLNLPAVPTVTSPVKVPVSSSTTATVHVSVGSGATTTVAVIAAPAATSVPKASPVRTTAPGAVVTAAAHVTTGAGSTASTNASGTVAPPVNTSDSPKAGVAATASAAITVQAAPVTAAPLHGNGAQAAVAADVAAKASGPASQPGRPAPSASAVPRATLVVSAGQTQPGAPPAGVTVDGSSTSELAGGASTQTSAQAGITAQTSAGIQRSVQAGTTVLVTASGPSPVTSVAAMTNASAELQAGNIPSTSVAGGLSTSVAIVESDGTANSAAGVGVQATVQATVDGTTPTSTSGSLNMQAPKSTTLPISVGATQAGADTSVLSSKADARTIAQAFGAHVITVTDVATVEPPFAMNAAPWPLSRATTTRAGRWEVLPMPVTWGPSFQVAVAADGASANAGDPGVVPKWLSKIWSAGAHAGAGLMAKVIAAGSTLFRWVLEHVLPSFPFVPLPDMAAAASLTASSGSSTIQWAAAVLALALAPLLSSRRVRRSQASLLPSNITYNVPVPPG